MDHLLRRTEVKVAESLLHKGVEYRPVLRRNRLRFACRAIQERIRRQESFCGMSLETKRVSGVRATLSDTEVTVHPHVRLYSANREADHDEIPAEWLDQLRTDRSDPMPLEMAPALLPYVILHFLPDSEAADKLVPLAVVFRRNTVPIIIIRHNWQIGLNVEDHKYLAELMDDWKRKPFKQLLSLFRQLECLSVGPITTTVSGLVTAEGLGNLTYTVLGQAGVSEQ